MNSRSLVPCMLSSTFRIFMAWAMFLTPFAAAKAAEPSAVDALTPQSVAAVTMRPARILYNPAFASLPIEVAEAAAEEYLGIKASSILRATIVIEPPMGMQPYYAVVVNLDEPFSLEENLHPELMAEIEDEMTPIELEGKYCLQPKQPMAPCLYMLDDQTLVAAPMGMLKKLLRQRASGEEVKPGPLHKAMLGAGGPYNDLHAVGMLEQVRPLLEFGLTEAANQVEPKLREFLDAPKYIRGGLLTVDLRSENESTLSIFANNEEDADQLSELLENGIELIRAQTFDDPKGPYAELLASGHPVQEAMAKYMLRSHREGVEKLRAMRTGKTRFDLLRLPVDRVKYDSIVLLGVIGALVGLLLPAVQAAREAARRNQSMNNMKQLILGLLNYESTYRDFPAQAICDPNGKPLLSWRVAILPYVEEQALYNEFHLDEPWDSPHNIKLLPRMPEMMLDPSTRNLEAADGKTHYLGVAGQGALFSGQPKGTSIRKITDGMSKTIAIVQVNDDHAVAWTKPEDYNTQVHQADPVGGIGSLHPNVFLAAFADGHVEGVLSEAPAEAINAAFTISGGEAIDLP